MVYVMNLLKKVGILMVTFVGAKLWASYDILSWQSWAGVVIIATALWLAEVLGETETIKKLKELDKETSEASEV